MDAERRAAARSTDGRCGGSPSLTVLTHPGDAIPRTRDDTSKTEIGPLGMDSESLGEVRAAGGPLQGSSRDGNPLLRISICAD